MPSHVVTMPAFECLLSIHFTFVRLSSKLNPLLFCQHKHNGREREREREKPQKIEQNERVDMNHCEKNHERFSGKTILDWEFCVNQMTKHRATTTKDDEYPFVFAQVIDCEY